MPIWIFDGGTDMKKRSLFVLAALMFAVSGCAWSTRVYYWEKPNTGARQFAIDHMNCLYSADIFPWNFKASRLWPFSPETLDLKLRLEDGGIWGNFIPYRGAQPIFVNTSVPSSTVVYWWYGHCMRNEGYTERKGPTGPIRIE